MPGLKLITAPAVEPVTLSEIKSKLGLQDGDVLDADLTMTEVSARKWVETHLGRALINQTWELALDAFPDSIELPYPPVSAVESVKYLDGDGVEQTLAGTEYTLDNYVDPAWLVPAYGKAWPATRADINAIKVRVTCGYGAAGSNVPEPIRHAIVLIAGMSLRGQSGQEASLYPASIPNAAKELLAPYRMMRF